MPQTPCLFAPADDRNAGDGGIALAGKCQVQGASLSEKKEGRALQCPQRAQFIPEQSESYTVSPSAAN